MALASGSRASSSFDWQIALPQGQPVLPPSILVMSASRQVLTMSQATSSPAWSLVARMSQILILQALRASFSSFSSGVSSRSFAVGGVALAAGLAPSAGVAPSSAAEAMGPEPIRMTATASRRTPYLMLFPIGRRDLGAGAKYGLSPERVSSGARITATLP